MADPATLGLLVGGTLLEAKGQSDVRHRQERLSNAMADYSRTKYGEGRDAINQFLQTIQPQAKADERQQLTDELATGLNQSVSAARAVETPQTVAGAVSPDYQARVASNDADLTSRLKRAVSQLSIIGAPAQQGLAEARRFGVAGGEVDASNTAANNVGAAYNKGIELQRPNSFLTLASQIMKGVGLARGIGGFAPALSAGAVMGSGLNPSAGGIGLKGTARVAPVNPYALL
jgi:hypothetical protein